MLWITSFCHKMLSRSDSKSRYWPSKAALSVAFSVTLLSGCMQTAEQFEAKPYAVRENVALNYQAAYQRIAAGLYRCAPPGGLPYGGTTLEAQLYPDLGYGEARTGTASAIIMQTVARIEKNGSGATISTKSSMPKHVQWEHDRFVAWALGATACFTGANGSGAPELAAFLAANR